MLAIVLGSGLSSLSEYFQIIRSVSFSDVLDIEFEELDGHERKFIWCRYEDEEFLVISGKLHYYEGFTFEEATLPLQYAIDHLGVDEIIITSASGGLSRNVTVGNWNWVFQISSVPETATHRKVKFDLREFSLHIKRKDRPFKPLKPARYAYHQGPSLGSEAEYKMLNYLGADLVGMSMYPECLFLQSRDVKKHFLSLPVCNYYPFENTMEPTFEEVIEVSSAAVPKLVDIFKQYLMANKN